MTRLSIIIPAGGDVSLLEDTLVSVLANRPPQCEIIVPHGGNYDDPYALQDEVQFLELPPRSSTADQIAAALDATTAPFVHLLAAGCEVDEDWCSPALECLSDPNVASVAPLVFSDEQLEILRCVGVAQGISGRRVEKGRGLSSTSHRLARLRVIGPTRLAAFYRRDALDCIGGWPAAVGALADIDVALSLRSLGYETAVKHGSYVVCQSPTTERIGAFTRSRQTERFHWRHAGGFLANLLHPAAMLAHCLSAGGPLAMLAAATGKSISLFDIPSSSRHRRRLAEQCGIARQNAAAQEADEALRAA